MSDVYARPVFCVIKTSVHVVLLIKQTKNMSESYVQWSVVEI